MAIVTANVGQPIGMPQKFMSKFEKLSLRSRRCVRENNPEGDSDSYDSENDDIDLYSSNMLSLITRNGPIILKRHKIFEQIFESGIPAQVNNFECITACGKTRNTVLLPCRHMHLCKECWFLLKTYELKKSKNVSFENDTDDSVTKPRCPYCRAGVESSDEVFL